MSFVQGPRAKATRPGGAIKMQQQAYGLCPAAQQQYHPDAAVRRNGLKVVSAVDISRKPALQPVQHSKQEQDSTGWSVNCTWKTALLALSHTLATKLATHADAAMPILLCNCHKL
jgi:hypothetical protein